MQYRCWSETCKIDRGIKNKTSYSSRPMRDMSFQKMTSCIWHPFPGTLSFPAEGHSDAWEGSAPSYNRIVMVKQHYEERLKLMSLPSLAYWRLRSDVIEVFECMHGIYNVDCTQILPYHKGTSNSRTQHEAIKRDDVIVREMLTVSQCWVEGRWMFTGSEIAL